MALRIKNPQAGDWDYDGCCAPGSPGAFSNLTFSIGIFQWIPKSRGSGIKRGKVIKRIKGYSSQPDIVYQLAEDWINKNQG